MSLLDKLTARLKDYRSRQILERDKRPTDEEWAKLSTELSAEIGERKHEIDR